MASNTETIKHFRLQAEKVPGSGTYASFCLLASRGIMFNKNTRDDEIHPCPPDDLYDPRTESVWVETTEVSKSGEISGEGKLSKDDFSFLIAWFNANNETRSLRLGVRSQDFDPGPATVRGYWVGDFHVTKLEFKSEDEEGVVGVSVTYKASGPVLWVDDPAA